MAMRVSARIGRMSTMHSPMTACAQTLLEGLYVRAGSTLNHVTLDGGGLETNLQANSASCPSLMVTFSSFAAIFGESVQTNKSSLMREQVRKNTKLVVFSYPGYLN